MKISLTLILIIGTIFMYAQQPEYYLLKTYHLKSNEQVEKVSNYLEMAYLPAMHSLGFQNIGVFWPIGNDTARSKEIWVFVPSANLVSLLNIEEQLASHDMHLKSGRDYWDTSHDQPAYTRVESSVQRAFHLHPTMAKPKLKSPMKDRIYELRSYEGASEKLYRKKVEMFNEGGEIKIFDDLNFNAVFYSETLVGAHTPNLVYMTTFENMDDRNAHWDAFRSAPAWKKLSAMEEYKNTVSKNNTYLLRPADYSDF
ncbi:MAG: NIPSNAP family containing protein [Saprospiraceae bacterium]|nr:NIPSNAP family containing protein [Saprospiraceae bacterium]